MNRSLMTLRTAGVLAVAAATLTLSACVVAPLPHRAYVRGGPVIIDHGPVYGPGYDHRGPPPGRWERRDERRHDHRREHHGHDRNDRD